MWFTCANPGLVCDLICVKYHTSLWGNHWHHRTAILSKSEVPDCRWFSVVQFIMCLFPPVVYLCFPSLVVLSRRHTAWPYPPPCHLSVTERRDAQLAWQVNSLRGLQVLRRVIMIICRCIFLPPDSTAIFQEYFEIHDRHRKPVICDIGMYNKLQNVLQCSDLQPVC